jgi:hypothetical protein
MEDFPANLKLEISHSENSEVNGYKKHFPKAAQSLSNLNYQTFLRFTMLH